VALGKSGGNVSSPIDDMPSIDDDRGMTEVRVRAPPKEQGISRPLWLGKSRDPRGLEGADTD
jgi:hypothetical protein